MASYTWTIWNTDERASVWGEKQASAGESGALCELVHRMRLSTEHERTPRYRRPRRRGRHDDSHEESSRLTGEHRFELNPADDLGTGFALW
ncbi:hypothetical protein [Streptomyces sp. NBC_01363]|uniref:hypothetical protein n=1 Tax=Streptomyces sp. NBC_01363 TaxID=2903840 RepID=UPI00225363FC|nr:hypothetical protein [Streptomyces sp. NBC_01363]MCX4736617.1 hypothetical protein [Streptomyces sp. NBC_01363]